MMSRALAILLGGTFLLGGFSSDVLAGELKQVPIEEVQQSMSKFQELLQEFVNCYKKSSSCSFDKKQSLYLKAKLEGRRLQTLTTRMLQILLAEGQSLIEKTAKRGLEDQVCKDLKQRLVHLKQLYETTSDTLRKQLILAQGDILFQRYYNLCGSQHLEEKLKTITFQIRILSKLNTKIDNLLYKLDEAYSSKLQELAKFDKELNETLQELSQISGLKSKLFHNGEDHPWLHQNF